FFQQKCAAAIKRLMDKGTTILFVSHDTSSVRALCNRAALLRDGRCVAVGEPGEIVNLYHATLSRGTEPEPLPAVETKQPGSAWRQMVLDESILNGTHRTTSGRMDILGC